MWKSGFVAGAVCVGLGLAGYLPGSLGLGAELSTHTAPLMRTGPSVRPAHVIAKPKVTSTKATHHGTVIARRPVVITVPGGPLKPPTGSTLFGASLEAEGGTMAQAVARETSKFGSPGVFRYYSPGLPTSWAKLNALTTKPLVVSFKDDPVRVASGADDAYLSSWFATAPRGRDVWWTYFHEPENDVEAGRFTAAQFRAAYRHVAALAQATGNPSLHSTLILMSWTAVTPTRNFADYYPGDDVVDVLGWDAYNRAAGLGKAYSAPDQVFGKVVALSQTVGKPWAVAETGAPLIPGDSGAARAAYLREAAAYLRDNGAVFVTYFDCTHGGAYTLADGASVRAWADQM